jgi:RNA polymerase sigma factor (sigma-70 family)
MHRWEDIYQSQAPRLLGLCRRYVRDLSLAEDLLHDAFLTAIHKQDSYSGSGPLEGWLRTITINTVLQYLRREKRLSEWQPETFQDSSEAIDEDLPDDPLQLLLNAGLDKTDLLEALDHLPDHHRVVFNLYVLEGYTHPQISAAIGISVGTSKSHLSRARKKIQAILLSKVQNMEQKKRRAAIIFFPFLKHREHPVDQLYRDALEQHTLPPGKTMPRALSDALQKAPPLPVPTPLFVAWKGLLGIGLLCLAGAGLWWFSHGSSETTMPSKAVPSTTTPANKQELTFINPSPEKQPAEPLRETDKAALPRKTASPPPPRPADNTAAATAPAPVVVRKKIVQKDTLYQLRKPADTHED